MERPFTRFTTTLDLSRMQAQELADATLHELRLLRQAGPNALTAVSPVRDFLALLQLEGYHANSHEAYPSPSEIVKSAMPGCLNVAFFL